MVVEASITGLFRTLLIIIGVIVLLRFLGQLMNAKRRMEEERKRNEHQRKFEEERNHKKRNFGRTNILGKTKPSSDVVDVDFEEID